MLTSVWQVMEVAALPEQRAWTYEEFTAARSSALFRTAYLLTGNRADAEDLLQAALIKVYAKWSRVSEATAPGSYARRILVNEFLSARRLARFRRERLVTSPPDVAHVDGDIDDRLVLWPLVAALPPRQRAVVVLRYYEGLAEREIADTLQMAPGTVKSTASAALAALRQSIGERG